VALNRVLVEQFIASQKTCPEELVLDIDASDIPLARGSGTDRVPCLLRSLLLPAAVRLLWQGDARLRPAPQPDRRRQACRRRDQADRDPLRQTWPAIRIIVRGDSGFCRQRLIRWCERHGVGYVIGMARNARLHRHVAHWEHAMEQAFHDTGSKQRMIRQFSYAAKSWDRERRLITRLEFGAQGTNPRFIVTNLDRPAEELYDDLYCQRGEAENRIKETQLDLFGTRASCHRFLANWLRILFSALAYTLMQRLREIALATTDLAKATAATIRVRLLKIGAAVIRNTRRIRILLASHHPLRDTYFIAANALASP
jgi:hypothetical protein